MKIAIQTVHPFPTLRTIATVRLDDQGVVRSDRAALLAEWTASGILGRASQGRLYPKDGRAFPEELPYAFRSPTFLAVVQG
jgi:hypothetical protein